MRLLLFDIDGTLIRSHGAGRQAMTLALQEMFGATGPIDDYRMDGKTDPRIITDLLSAAKYPRHEIEKKLPEIYRLMAKHGRDIFPQQGITALPGIQSLLAQLHEDSNLLLGLLTGNSSHTAPLKLIAAGLNPAIFQVGAYGSDHMDRNALPAIAMKRAEELTGKPFNGNNTIIIGDTPADILCARAGQATAVAVATGSHPMENLAQYKPEYLFENLLDNERFLAILQPQSG